MSGRAKVFMNGRSQAIRLPKAFRVHGAEVVLKRVPEGILISEGNPWDVCMEACRELSGASLDAVAKRRKNPPLEERAWAEDE